MGESIRPVTRVALHEQIAQSLRQMLANSYQPGDRFPSQNELARQFGVTPNTAREAVAQLVQEGLLERRFGSGTFVTEQRVDSCIAVVTELDIAHPDLSSFWPHLIQGLRQRFAQHGRLTRLYVGHSPPFGAEPAAITSQEFTLDLAAGRIAAVALVGTQGRLLQAALAGRALPWVDTGQPGGVPLVDYPELVRRGLAVMAERGCRRVACMALTPGMRSAPILELFLAEAQRYGLQTSPAWARAASFGQHPELAPATVFRQLWNHRAERPEGLLVLDDMLYRAITPMLLYNRHQLPPDLVLVSHRNSRDTRPLSPAPIGLSIDPAAAGHAVADYLNAVLRGADVPPRLLPIPITLDEPEHAQLALSIA